MKFQKTVLQSAVALAFGTAAATAIAGSVGVTTQEVATNNFGTGSGALAFAATGLGFQLANNISPGQNFTLYVQLSGGAKWAAAPGVIFCTDAGLNPVPSGAIAVSADQTFISTVVPGSPFGYSTISVCNVGPAPVTNLSALATAGTTINATVTLDSQPPQTTVPTAGVIDSGTGAYFHSANAISGAITASSAFTDPPFIGSAVETTRINVGATPALTAFLAGGTSNTASPGTLVNLGAVIFSDVAGIQTDPGAADYTIGGKIASMSGNVTGDFGAVGATGKVFVAGDPACAGAIGAPATLDAAKAKATLTGLPTPASGAPTYVCFQTDGTTPIAPQIPRGDFTLVPAAATDAKFSVGPSDLYQLRTNGALVTIRYHLPAGTPGYSQFYRIINTGTLTTDVRGTPIAEDGTVGTSGVLLTALKPGEVRNVTNAEMQTNLGFTPAANARPRVQISGSTQNLTVQNFLCGPDGTCIEISTGQSVPPVNPTNP